MNKKLRELRKEKGVSQEQVANELGISTSAYSNYEQGIREPSIDMLIKLCKYYNVTSDYLIGINEY